MKRIFATIFTCVFLLCTAMTTVYANTSDTKSKVSSEFGTLTGTQSYSGIALGRKIILFRVETTKSAPVLKARVQIADYATGVSLDEDVANNWNSTWASGMFEGHSDDINTKKISSFGSHEARGNGSSVVYTTLVGV